MSGFVGDVPESCPFVFDREYFNVKILEIILQRTHARRAEHCISVFMKEFHEMFQGLSWW